MMKLPQANNKLVLKHKIKIKQVKKKKLIQLKQVKKIKLKQLNHEKINIKN